MDSPLPSFPGLADQSCGNVVSQNSERTPIHLNPQQSKKSSESESSEERSTAVRKYVEVYNRLGIAFREAQQEAYELWSAVDEEEGEGSSQ